MSGFLVGFLSIFMLWTLFFATLSGVAKLVIFGFFTTLYIAIQMYAFKELKKPNWKQSYNLAAFQQEIRNYKWVGIFFLGVASPYICSLLVYVVLKNL